MTTTAYTDGACLGNPGPGGWAYAVSEGRFRSGAENPSTNQRMEITAALRAVEDLDGDLEIVSDSTYVVNCFRDKWWQAWIQRGWLTAAKKPVANRDLWEPLITEVRRRNVSFRWVKGHGTDDMNDIVDRLAVEAAQKQQGRTGFGRPENLGPPDRAGDITAPGRRIAVFGPRPPELGGWGGGPLADAVRDKVADIVMAKARLHGSVVLVTGLNLGVEQMAAEMGLPYVAVLPFPGQEEPWPAAGKSRYRDLLGRAAQVIEVTNDKPADREAFGRAFGRRDDQILKMADEAIVVWDGEDKRVKRQLDEAKRALGEEEVWVVNTAELARS